MWPTSASATSTIRLASLPRFMISPASMKNGTAISGKLSAPLMMFWATIWESKMSSECISATPQTISANAIGMPSAIAPSKEKVKTASVTPGSVCSGDDSGVLIAFLHQDQVFFGARSAQHPYEINEQDHGRRDAEHQPGGIEEQPDRNTGGGRGVAEGQHRLLPASERQQPVHVE